MSLIGNIYEDLRYQWVKLVGLIFTAQAVDGFTGTGKPRFWVSSTDKKAHFTDTDGNDSVVAREARAILTTAPLTGGGDLSVDRTFAVTIGAAGDVAPIGPAKQAGAVGKVADAGHVHQADKSAFRVAWFAGVDASGAPSHVVVAALKAGDQVLAILDVTAAPAVDGSAEFEAAVTVDGQLQQPAHNDSAKRYVGFFIAKS